MIRPELSDKQISELESDAEAKIYESCKNQLKDKYLILHSISWVHKNVSGDIRDGEADFVIFDPDGGFIVIEVKGGGIRYDSVRDLWFSTDRKNIEHKIKNPFRQSLSQKNVILNNIQNHKDYKYLNGRLLMGHAVFFVDLDNIAELSNSKVPQEIVGGRFHLNKFQQWVEGVFSYYSGQTDRFDPLGTIGISIVKDLFCKDIHVKPLLKFELEKEEEKRIKLTEEQARIFTMLGSRKKALISGGAGTGKTLLAIQLATNLASDGHRTLLICYNNLLGGLLESNAMAIKNLEASSYFSFISSQAVKVKNITGRDLLKEAQEAYPGDDTYDIQLPYALALAAEVINEKFDAIIVDEGQDFHDEYWMGVEDFLVKDGYFYIFYDNNQRIYNKPTNFPIKEEPYYLTHNCRNTDKIHEFAYKFYGGIKTYPPDILGHSVEFIEAASTEKQAVKIHSLIIELLQKESISSSQIKVLLHKKTGKHQELLFKLPLPKPLYWKGVGDSKVISSSLKSKHEQEQECIQIETIGRFKGLEADILILWGLEHLDPERDRELFYVATSRAKSRLFIAANENFFN